MNVHKRNGAMSIRERETKNEEQTTIVGGSNVRRKEGAGSGGTDHDRANDATKAPTFDEWNGRGSGGTERSDRVEDESMAR